MTPKTWGALRLSGFAVLVAAAVAGAAQMPARIPIGAVGAVGGPGSVGPPSIAPGSVVAAPVSETVLDCPGPETEGISGLEPVTGEAVTVFAATAPVVALTGVATVSGPGSLTAQSHPSGAALATSSTRGSVISGALSGSSTAAVTGLGGLAAGVAALQTGLRRDGDERGLQAVTCQTPRSDVWLLAGGGAATRRERLVVSNSGANALSVDVQVLGASGPVPSISGSRVAVPPHGRVGVLIDALAPGEPSPAVHVTASGGLITALLEDSWIDGATGRGRDNVGPADGPATEQTIPAAFLTGTGTLRIAVPGSDEAVVQARLIGTAGALALPSDGVVRIPGGTVRDIDLAAVPPGAYAVQVRSDRPVVASVLVQRRPTPEGPSDLGWAAASPVIPELAGTPVPPGTTATLLVVGVGEVWSATVYAVSATGEVTTLDATADADTAWVSAVPAGAVSVWVRPTAGAVRAGLVAEASDAGGPLVTVFGLEPITLSTSERPVREVRR